MNEVAHWCWTERSVSFKLRASCLWVKSDPGLIPDCPCSWGGRGDARHCASTTGRVLNQGPQPLEEEIQCCFCSGDVGPMGCLRPTTAHARQEYSGRPTPGRHAGGLADPSLQCLQSGVFPGPLPSLGVQPAPCSGRLTPFFLTGVFCDKTLTEPQTMEP